ncbi:hypothetical protein C2R22_16610 [Salinigranum rubrum]|uniref:DUF7979 domain-containing protein n=1 Tax=Salinigranum rubrum TaxID=755307 RepID=A0A2I8VMB1_9EURY|nr:hypothetical protein [Salinigranum rubrum]AUV83066.1 hypothetical protein C2R22_16610 [Salinigranum rubrum]
MSRSAGPTLDGQVTLVPTSQVTASDDVRHFDQLTARAKRAVIAAADDRPSAVSAPSLAAVDVVVFTDYYRVE